VCKNKMLFFIVLITLHLLQSNIPHVRDNRHPFAVMNKLKKKEMRMTFGNYDVILLKIFQRNSQIFEILNICHKNNKHKN
jgi:hypothetical protein